MLDTSLSMTIKINAQEQDARTKAWYDVVHEVRVDAASNVLFELVSVWVDNVTDVAKKTQAWCLFLKYIIQGLNKTPASVSDLSNVYQIQIENNNLYTLGDDFGETIADPSQLNPDQQNNRTVNVAESIAMYSNYRGTIRLLGVSDSKNPTGKRV